MIPIKMDTANTELDWGDYDPTLYPMDGCILSEVHWGAHDSSLFLYLVHIDHDATPNYSSPRIEGRTTTKNIFHHSHGVPERFS